MKSTQLRKVLILEDDVELGFMVEEVVKSLYPRSKVDLVPSAEEGLALINASAYDAIFSDIFLEGESTGVDFLRVCREIYPETPIVLTSGLSHNQFARTLDSGEPTPAFLKKPFSALECRRVFKQLLSRTSTRANGSTPR